MLQRKLSSCVAQPWLGRLIGLAGVACLLAAGPARALPVLAVDMDPGSPGIQATRSVALGSTVTIDLVAQDFTAIEPLQAFELDLDFAPAVLSASAMSVVGFLVTPVFEVERTIGVASVALAAATLGPSGASGTGVLVSITFEAFGPGTSPLDLRDVLLSAPFGEPIDALVSDGSITVVPEPSALVLVCAGLIGMHARRGWVRHSS